MIPRIIFVTVVAIVVLWIIAYATGEAALRQAAAAPWPYGLGSVERLSTRFQTTQSPEDRRLAPRFQDFPEIDADPWIAEQVKKTNDAIDPLPANLSIDRPKVTELVSLVIASGDRLVWGLHPGMTNAVNAIAVAALDDARRGDSAAAWNALHAMWLLTRSLRYHGAAYSKVKALELERLTNAIARKLSPPVPPWFAEVSEIDTRRDGAAALQAEAWIMTQFRPQRRDLLLGFLFRPLLDRLRARTIRDAHAVAEALTARRCRVDDAVIKSVQRIESQQIAYRATRLDAEIEATAKILALKAERARLGHWPPPSPEIAASRCAGNVWKYTIDDGTMSLGMSFEPPWEPMAKIVPQVDFAY